MLDRALDGLGVEGGDLLGLGFGAFVAAEIAMNPRRFRSVVSVGSPKGSVHGWVRSMIR
jgi:hypothetical protein